MMRKNKPISSMTAVTLWLLAVMLAVWCVSMVFATRTLARTFREMAGREGDTYAAAVGRLNWLDTIYSEGSSYLESRGTETPGWTDYDMLRALAGLDHGTGGYISEMELTTRQTAGLICDMEGNILHQSSDYIYFAYYSEAEWREYYDGGAVSGCAYIDLEAEPWKDDLCAVLAEGNEWGFPTMRLTGWLEGAKFHPVKLEYVTYSAFRQTLNAGGDWNDFLWEVLFDYTEVASNELITVYTGVASVHVYEEGRTLLQKPYGETDKTQYQNLLELLTEKRSELLAGKTELYNLCMQQGLEEAIVFDIRYYSYSGAGDKEYNPEADFALLTAVAYRPMEEAAKELLSTYVWTLVFGLVCVLILRRVISRKLIKPMEKVNREIANDWKGSVSYDEWGWREPEELRKNYNAARDKLQRSRNEILRLNTALDYAKKAEESRRQLVSGAAHELKTPLAVIHSYAEGLKDQIAEEKREKYLDTILEESEKMDALVLEMLDLSRLEAGKVKLAADRFSLTELVRGVFDKLEPLAQKKQLQITLDLEDCVVNADESRITQAVSNYASNAIRYTPEGGSIQVRLVLKNRVEFSVENDSEPFSEEELRQVWESFYRRDKSRSRKGTGLGLAITRSIIELHGGTCTAYNTDNGVGFCFTLPDGRFR